MRTKLLVFSGLFFFSVVARAGVFLGTADCPTTDDCAPRAINSDPSQTARPFAVTHPPVYDGSGGPLVLSICVLTGSERLIAPTQRAIATWNALLATTGNCAGCSVWEEGPFPAPGVVHAETTLLHELGHCPLGLDHPDRTWDAADDGFWEPTSFTRSWDVARPPNGIRSGPDFVRGTLDDLQQVAGGGIPASVHWFRVSDNNPFAIDGAVIDSSTFSRSIATNLPQGHGWAANANRVVGDALGLSNTQAVMYGLQVEGEIKTSLTADDVNMVKMALTGQDFAAGTADDNTVELQYVTSCDGADVLITFGEIINMESLAECETRVDYSFPQSPLLARHLNVIPPSPGQPLVITLNQDLTWDTGFDGVFADGFEAGDTSSWGATVIPRRAPAGAPARRASGSGP